MNRVIRPSGQVEGLVRGWVSGRSSTRWRPDWVFAEAGGAHEALTGFLVLLRERAPPRAVVDNTTARDVEARGETCFRLIGSTDTGTREVLVSSDSATCDGCLREPAPADRRFGYPFVHCTHCGPRSTTAQVVPYDRPPTTMAGRAPCARCSAEYEDPDDRRFHVQPVRCPECGAQLSLLDAAERWLPEDPVEQAAASPAAGKVLAVQPQAGRVPAWP